jgi:hypothetical protein
VALVGGDPGGDLTGPTKAKLHRELFGMDDPVTIHTHALVESVDWPDVTLRERGRAVELSDLDSIVLGGFHRANDDLAGELASLDAPVHRVGDAVAPRTIQEAIHEGERAARKL